jgi:hypothetical protein
MERSLEEINAHHHEILPDAEKYRVTRCRLDAEFTTGKTTLVLNLIHSENGSRRELRFENVVIEESTLCALKDATGLYVFDTHHLGWAESSRIEVGDWDGGPPLFWAERVEDTKTV